MGGLRLNVTTASYFPGLLVLCYALSLPGLWSTWQQAFTMLQTYYDVDPDLAREETAKLYGELQTWNDEHMGTLSLAEENMAFIMAQAGVSSVGTTE